MKLTRAAAGRRPRPRPWLGKDIAPPAVDHALTVVGCGLAIRGDGRGGGTLRAAQLRRHRPSGKYYRSASYEPEDRR